MICRLKPKDGGIDAAKIYKALRPRLSSIITAFGAKAPDFKFMPFSLEIFLPGYGFFQFRQFRHAELYYLTAGGTAQVAVVLTAADPLIMHMSVFQVDGGQKARFNQNRDGAVNGSLGNASTVF